MANISKFHQVTNFVLLEYKTDQYAALNKSTTPESLWSNMYMYKTLTGKQAVIDMHNFAYTVFPDAIEDDYYFPGIWTSKNVINELPLFTDNNDKHTYIQFKNPENTVTGYYKNQNTDPVATIIPDTDNNLVRHSPCLYDTIRVYFTVGYVLNSVHGLQIKVEGQVKQVTLITPIDATIPALYRPTKYRKVNDTITLLDWFMPKSSLPNVIKMLPTPLYFNSKFYDKYIEIKFPSCYDLALNGPARNIDYTYETTFRNPYDNTNVDITYKGYIDPSSPGIISVATVSDDYVTYHNANINEITYSHDTYTKIPITFESNSKYFNVELYEDEESGTVIYQPVYGEPSTGQKLRDFDIFMMQQIELGEIPMLDRADADSANDGMEDFIEAYGVETYKWCIINELSVSYHYDYITESDRASSPDIIPYTEYFTNTIDYTGKTSEHGAFYKSRFMPFIQERPAMVCTKISIRYTAHLYNRMNNREICRSASIIISNPTKYTRTVINTSSISTYKVINKIILNTVETVNPGLNNGNTSDSTDNRYVPSQYISITDLAIRMNNDTYVYTLGTGTLKLTNGPQQYLFLFYYTGDTSNTRLPLELNSTNKKYKLVFPLGTGEKMTFYSVDDKQGSDMVMGKLMFFISGDEAARIMGFTGEHTFSIIEETNGHTSEDATMYTGKVDWLWA